MTQIYDAKKDPQFAETGYIDMDEKRERLLDDGTVLPFRYMHGGFSGTGVKFSFCFPEKKAYEGRFYQYLSPFPGPEEEIASLPVTGIDDKIAFAITHGAYYVETNMGSRQAFAVSEDKTMSWRSSAAAAEFSRVKACEVYGYQHRPYGYVYGGSGGGYRTIACIENTNAFDGAAPYVIGSPYAIPNCQTTRARVERICRRKLKQVVDLIDAGQNPFQILDEEEKQALRETTDFGYPLKSWFVSADLNEGSLPVLVPGIKKADPQYFTDFWTRKGYEGADKNSSACRDRISIDTKIRLVCIPNQDSSAGADAASIDTRNGVNNAWKKMISGTKDHGESWIELEEVPKTGNGADLYLNGLFLTVTNGRASGKKLQVREIQDRRVFFKPGYMCDDIESTINLLQRGDDVHLDNSDFIAAQNYHRHQVPTPDYHAWDQFRGCDGLPMYPQREKLLGPMFSGNGTGSRQNGLIQGKIIICAALMDEQAYPWQADWYRRKVASVHGGDESGICRLYYFDNCLHDDVTASADEIHATTYIAGLKQALIDLAAWVEKGIEPLPSSSYTIAGGQVLVSDSARERGGLQAVPHLTANGARCLTVRAGHPVHFLVDCEVPKGAGKLTSIRWSFEGEQDYPVTGEWYLNGDHTAGLARAEHTYMKPGRYLAAVRVTSERNGDPKAPFTQIRNIDHVCISVVE